MILLLLRFVKGALITQGYIHNTYTDRAFPHKSTAPIPNDDGSIPDKAADKGVVVFILGVNTNHPMGIFAPGFRNVGDYFQNMWEEAEADREKWGCEYSPAFETAPKLIGLQISAKQPPCQWPPQAAMLWCPYPIGKALNTCMHSLMARVIVLAGTGGPRRTKSIPISVSCMKRTLCRKGHGRTSIKISSQLACVSQCYSRRLKCCD